MSSSAESGSEKCYRVSKRISSPCRNAKSLLKPVLSPVLNSGKSETNSKCSSPNTSIGSGEDNGVVSPTLSTVTNGSPAVTEDGKIPEKSKSGGRLKFFKDGVLCLELSHHDEGERTKWVQIKTKTVMPAIVHTTKEATIPCHLAPNSFSSPSAANLRVESSTSHSMSDDGSSMLSSPRDRESTWKQSVPLKGVSACREFFMKPARCVFKYRKHLQVKPLYKFRRPYTKMPPIDNIILCSCVEVNVENLKIPNGELNDGNNETDVDSIDLSLSKARSRMKKAEPSLDNLVMKLEKIAKSVTTTVKLNDSNYESKPSPQRSNSITPKKRVLRDEDSRDSNFRPKKKSPSGTIEKTILTIPGLNSEFYKRHTSTVTNDLPSSAYVDRSNRTAESSVKAVNLTKGSNKSKNRIHSHLSSNSSSTSTKSRRSPYLGAKSVSTSKQLLNSPELRNNPLTPNQVVESAILLSNYGGRGNASPNAKSRSSAEEKQKEQQLFQQQTMSKAISYTINSLLGTGNSTGDNAFNSGNTNHLYNGKIYSGSTKTSTKSHSPPSKSKANCKLSSNDHNPAKKRGSFPALENDQNSFLRHLLDTSDPIPCNKTERSAIISNKNIKSNSKSNHSGSRNVNNPTSTANKSLISTKSPSKPVSNSSSRSASPPYQNSRHSLQSQLLHPLGADISPYSNLFRPTDSSAAFAAAAAAFQHYGSLLPAAFLPHLASSPVAAAAAAAAAYLVPTPQGVTTSSSPTVPPLHYVNNNILNLSQNIWPGFLPGSSLHPPFVGSLSEDFQSLSAIQHRNSNSPYFEAHSSEQRDKNIASSSIDNDTPLNLCKKTSPS